MSLFKSLSIINVEFASLSEKFKSKEFCYVEFLARVIVLTIVWVGMDSTPYLHPVGSLDQLSNFLQSTCKFIVTVSQ
jgi:hypothetical protein